MSFINNKLIHHDYDPTSITHGNEITGLPSINDVILEIKCLLHEGVLMIKYIIIWIKMNSFA